MSSKFDKVSSRLEVKLKFWSYYISLAIRFYLDQLELLIEDLELLIEKIWNPLHTGSK